MLEIATQCVRHLESGESLPPELRSGLEAFKLDGDWVWCYEDGGIKACLVMAPCHGFVHVLRLCAAPDAPPMAVAILLKAARKEVRERGFKAVAVFLEASTKTDIKLARVAEKFEMVGIPRLGFWCAGRL